jgi:hypothetical protein
MLFLQGTRDAFARWDLLEAALASLGERARLVRVEGGDHSFKVPRGGGGKPPDVEADISRAMQDWLAEMGL